MSSRANTREEEKAAISKWLNQVLSSHGSADLITDLGTDIADGTTLFTIIQALANEPLPTHLTTPIMRSDKLKNLQTCLAYLKKHNVPIDGVQAEALLAGDINSILSLCNSLRKHYSGEVYPHKKALVYSAVDKDDIAVLTWLGQLLHRDITSYSLLYSGNILCELINEIKEGAISDKELESADAAAKLKLAESAAKKYLFMASPFDPLQVAGGGQNSKLCSFLKQCRILYQQKLNRNALPSKSLSKERLPGGREGREAAHIASRSYDAIQRKRSESHNQPSKKKPPELYVQGASSFTDLISRRAEHMNMIGGSGRGGSGITKHSSSENLDKHVPFGNSLDRVQSMESGISQEKNRTWKRSQSQEEKDTALPRSASQGSLPPGHLSLLPPSSQHPNFNKSLTRSTESFHTQTFGLSPTRRTPSIVRLDSNTSSEDLVFQLNALEERVGILATQFLYERQDMFKQILRALVKERKRRQITERRLEAVERASLKLVQHYDSRFIDIAKEVAALRSALRSEVASMKGSPLSPAISTEIEELKELLAGGQIAGLHRSKEIPDHLPSAEALPLQNTLFLRKVVRIHMTERLRNVPISNMTIIRQWTVNKFSLATLKRATSEQTNREAASVPNNDNTLLGPYSKGSAASFKKLSRFFGEDPPRVEDLRSLLESLGYTHLLPKLLAHNITIAELQSLTESHLEAIGIPLGVRIRLLEEAKKLVPIKASQLWKLNK